MGSFLITGVAGTGKSTICRALKELGKTAFDADYERDIAFWQNKKTGLKAKFPKHPSPNWSKNHDWLWDIDSLNEVLSSGPADNKYIFGNASNKSDAYSVFGKVIFLVANPDQIIRRVKERQDNNFGKLPSERKLILADLPRSIEEANVHGFNIIDTTRATPLVLAREIVGLCENEDC